MNAENAGGKIGPQDNMAIDRELRVLLLEDVPTDAELSLRELKRAGIGAVPLRVDTRDEFIAAFDRFKPDVVLLDFSLPHFDGKSAVHIAHNMHPEIPLIIVTGTLPDESAIELLRSGAADYVLKSNLVRLPTAVRRALKEEYGRRNRKQAERALRVLSTVNHELIHAQDEDALLHAVCRTIVDIGGYRLAWVGAVLHNERKSVLPAAHYGDEEDFQALSRTGWVEDAEPGDRPTGKADLTGAVQITDGANNDSLQPQRRNEAKHRGYRSVIAFPLKDASGIFASLTICAPQSQDFNHDEVKLLQELADDLAFGVGALRMRAENDRLTTERIRQQELLRKSLVDSIQTLGSVLELRDPYTAGHQRRVARLAAAIARETGMSEHRIEGLVLAANIHDLGKIQTPSEILNRPGRLTAAEFALIRMHPQAGHDLIKDIQFPWPIARMLLEHHEHLDGSGYPNGLREDDILPESKILTVADVVEAMVSHRPYRPALGQQAALQEILEHRGTWFDPAAVDACLSLFREERFSFEQHDVDSANSGSTA